jgi:choline dehydrogenase-like flavoprotein
MSRGLGKKRRKIVGRLLPGILGLPDDDPELEVAVGRAEDLVRALPQARPRNNLRLMLDVVDVLAVLLYFKPVTRLDEDELAGLLEHIFDSEQDWPHNFLRIARVLFGDGIPSMNDFARALLEFASIVYYSNPRSHRWTGYLPLWEQPRVLAAHPATADDLCWTSADRTRLDIDAIGAKLAEGADVPLEKLFADDGRPKVAIIGSGCGGAPVAAALAGRYDVAIFEAGPRLRGSEFAMDPLAGQALAFDRGLLYPTKNLDVRILLGRVVGGGSAVNEGVTVRPRSSMLDAWGRAGLGLDRALLNRSIEAVAERQRFTLYDEKMFTEVALRFGQGCEAVGLRADPLLSDIATWPAMHEGQPHGGDGVHGDRCLACGHCSHGCRYGHHLSMDRTFLRDAEAAGARIHPNLAVDHLVPARDPATGELRVAGLKLARDKHGEMVAVDHVVLAAGSVGTSALVRRSIRRRPAWRKLPGRKHVGRHFGVNYGTAVMARFEGPTRPPGHDGLQVGFVASKPGDESFIIENGWISPAIYSSLIPAFGRDHRRLMGLLPDIGFCVNTIGSANDGRVTAGGEVDLKVRPGAMGLIHETLASMVDLYLHAGAVEVRVAGVRTTDAAPDAFDPSWKGKEAEIRAKIAAMAPTPEHVALSSGHPQGGMRMNGDPGIGVVGGDFRVHGASNLFVADASLFPDTITINPQWLIMSLGHAAGIEIGRAIEAAKG